MRSILNEGDRTAITNRMRSLSVSSTRRWGSMDLVSMLRHLQLSARMTLGELDVPSVNKRAFQVFPLKHLILYVLPFPKGAPTAPKLKPDSATSLEEERAARRVGRKIVSRANASLSAPASSINPAASASTNGRSSGIV